MCATGRYRSAKSLARMGKSFTGYCAAFGSWTSIMAHGNYPWTWPSRRTDLQPVQLLQTSIDLNERRILLHRLAKPGQAIIASITKGKEAPRKVSVTAIPFCQKTCGIALLYSCAAIPCAILLQDRDARPAVFMYQGSVLASPSRTPYTGEKPSNSEIFVMSA